MKSPIRSPLQSKSLRSLKSLIPIGSNVTSFMLYGGDIELGLAQSGRRVHAYTNKHVIYEFWATLKEDKEKILSAVDEFYPQIDSVLFHYLQESWPQFGDCYIRSAFFFMLNRCSERGEISTGKINKNHFNPVALNYLKNFQGMNFYPRWDKKENPLDMLSQLPNADCTVFPMGEFNYNLFEYGKSRGYEMTSVNHRELCERVGELNMKIIIVYPKHPQLFKMYGNYNIQMIDKNGRQTDAKDKCQELVIANF